MARRKKLTLNDWSHIPTTPVENKSGYETLREYTERLKREEAEAAARAKAEAEAPAKALVAEYSKNLVALRRAQASALLEIPSEELRGMCQQVPDEVEGNAAQVTEQIRSAFEKMQRDLANEGIILSASGLDKLKRIAQLNSGSDIRLASVWVQMAKYAIDLGALTAEDVTLPRPAQPVVNPTAETVPDLSELETLNLSSREGSARGKVLANEFYYSVEAASVYQKWQSWLYETFKYVLTEDAKKAAIRWFQDNNQSYLDGKAWTRCRLNLARRGIIPDLRTDEERLMAELETADTNKMSFEERQNLNSRLSHYIKR